MSKCIILVIYLISESLAIGPKVKPVIKELWTNKQRQMSSIHYTVSYRGSFKPELPEYFIRNYLDLPNKERIRKFIQNGEIEKIPIVFDPFVGRGTTIIQANIMGAIGWGNDINKMSRKIIAALTNPPTLEEVKCRLNEIPLDCERDDLDSTEIKELGLKAFYHKETLKQLLNLKDYLAKDDIDHVDRFIEIVAMSRLHGHSAGFFSAYSFPQFSVSPISQLKINQKHGNPIKKDIKPRIIKKARESLADSKEYSIMRFLNKYNKLTSFDIRSLPSDIYPDNSVDLIITSPPFLAQVDYISDNWLECWFMAINQDEFKGNLVQTPNLERWSIFMEESLSTMFRVLKPNHYCIIEVGDVNNVNRKTKDKIFLDDIISEIGTQVGFSINKRIIHKQYFTKLSNCFNVENNKKGVNTQRLVIFEKVKSF